MTDPATVPLAFNVAGIDGSLFTTVTNFARATKWLNTPLDLWTNAGLLVFVVFIVMCWWKARSRATAEMTLALAAPVAVAVSFIVAEVAKKLVAEVRPCYSLPHDYFVDSCPMRSDYAFPSAHSTVAFATVGALFLIDRRLAAIATVFALFEGFTRVYLGDHYPHDILGAAVLSLPVAYLTTKILGRIAVPLVARLRTGVLKPVLTAAPSGSHAG
jgi:undecaprenyl-diphosphatase